MMTVNSGLFAPQEAEKEAHGLDLNHLLQRQKPHAASKENWQEYAWINIGYWDLLSDW